MQIRILFIGNSYTYFHDMPEAIFLPMAQKAGLDVQVTAVTHGGYWLNWFADPENEEGKAFLAHSEAHPEDELYFEDLHHSSPLGSAVAARTILDVILAG